MKVFPAVLLSLALAVSFASPSMALQADKANNSQQLQIGGHR
jgi:hypothetical protein